MEQGYERQTSPRAAAAMPLANPDQFGAGVARAAGQMGEQLHQQQLRTFQLEQKQNRDRELADWSHQYALHRQNMDDIVRTTRGNAPAGAVGHREAVIKAHQAARDSLFGKLTDPDVIRHAQAQWDQYETGLADAEGTFEEAQRVAKLVTDFGQGANIGANRIRNSGDEKAYASELQIKLGEIDLLSVDGAQKDKLRRQVEQDYGIAFVQRLQDTNPVMARGLLDSGAFNHLDPGVLEQLRSGADVEIRRQQAAVEHQASLEAAQARENIATLSQAMRDGLEVDDAQVSAAIEQARAMGDSSTVLTLEGLRADATFAKVYRGQSPVQREQRVAQLASQQTRSVAEQRELKWLQDKRSALDSRFDDDAVAWAMENAPQGYKPTVGDISDPAVIQGRIAWARRASDAYGRAMPYFTKAEVGQLAARKGESRAGEQAVLGLLDRFPEGPDRAIAARQIAPDDKVFQSMAQLSTRARQTVRAGADALKVNAQFLKPSADAPEVAEMMQQVEGEVAQALKLVSKEDQEAVLTVARQFMAGVNSGTNLSADTITESNWRLAVRVALGGSVKPGGKNVGGIGKWGSTPYVLPDGYDHNDFYLAVRDDMLARKVAPMEPDGKTTANLRYARPVWMGADPSDPGAMLYRWEDRSGRVIGGFGGTPFVSKIKVKP